MTFSLYLTHNEPIFKSLGILPPSKLSVNLKVGVIRCKIYYGLTQLLHCFLKYEDVHFHHTRNKTKCYEARRKQFVLLILVPEYEIHQSVRAEWWGGGGGGWGAYV